MPPPADKPARRIGAAARRKIAFAPDSWWKRLAASEAQRLEQGHVTGNIALTGDPETELAEFQANVEIGGPCARPPRARLVFRAYRADRGRATTVMRLGPNVRAAMRARRVLGWFFIVERSGLGAYRVRITPRRPA